MHSKTILVSCGRTITLERASALFSSMDADVRALKVPPAQALSSGHGLGVDLLVIDDTDGGCDISAIEAELASGGDSTLFLMLDESRMKSVRLPVRVTSDFACSGASDDEIKLRCRRLLWPGEMTSDADFIHMGTDHQLVRSTFFSLFLYQQTAQRVDFPRNIFSFPQDRENIIANF